MQHQPQDQRKDLEGNTPLGPNSGRGRSSGTLHPNSQSSIHSKIIEFVMQLFKLFTKEYPVDKKRLLRFKGEKRTRISNCHKGCVQMVYLILQNNPSKVEAVLREYIEND